MIAPTVAELLSNHVRLTVEGIDRMYLNVYVPRLQCTYGAVSFFRDHRGQPLASSALMSPMSRRFVAELDRFIARHRLPVVLFRKGQRKDDVMVERLRDFRLNEGVVFVGKAQEKAPVFRTEKRHSPRNGRPYPWIVKSTAMVNHYYIYAVDSDFGPFFLKFCTYFPYNAKLCLNGHEYAKRQLERQGITYQALDNGVLSCADPQRLQQICDGLSADKIDRLLRKWLHFLPHPFTAADQKAGFGYDISILQAEFSLTQVLDRPVHGRLFFEQVIRENLDLGRPDEVQLIFDRRITRRTPDACAPASSPRASPPLSTSITRTPGSSSITRSSALCAPKPRSTTPTTSASANDCTTCRNCVKSGSTRTAGCSKSSVSVMTASSPRTPFSGSTARSSVPANAPPDCALPIPASTPCGMPWCSSAYCQTAFAEPTCVTTLRNSAAAIPKPSGRGP